MLVAGASLRNNVILITKNLNKGFVKSKRLIIAYIKGYLLFIVVEWGWGKRNFIIIHCFYFIKRNIIFVELYKLYFIPYFSLNECENVLDI